MQAISGLQYTPNISMLNPNINYAFCFINYVSALLSSKKMTNSPEYCIYTSVMNTCCVNKKGFQFLSFLFLLIPFSFSFFPLSFTTTLSRAPAFLFFCFSVVGEIWTNSSLWLWRTCLSSIPLDHDDLLKFPGQKLDIFFQAQVQIYITKQLKHEFL